MAPLSSNPRGSFSRSDAIVGGLFGLLHGLGACPFELLRGDLSVRKTLRPLLVGEFNVVDGGFGHALAGISHPIGAWLIPRLECSLNFPAKSDCQLPARSFYGEWSLHCRKLVSRRTDWELAQLNGFSATMTMLLGGQDI